MAKDKPASQKSMKDLLMERSKGQQKQSTQERSEDFMNTTVNSLYNDSFQTKLKNYNESILILDQNFRKVTPRYDILVRAFTRPLIKDGDVIIPPTLPVDIRTQNNRGKAYQVENPYPFFNKVVIVSKPKNIEDLQVGDVAIVDANYKFVEAFGNGDNAFIKVNGFIHPDDLANYNEYPTNPEDPNYGYFLVPNHLIKAVL